AIAIALIGSAADRAVSALEMQLKLKGVFGPPIFRKGTFGRPLMACEGNSDLLEEAWFWNADGGGRDEMLFTQYCAGGQVGTTVIHRNASYAALHRGDEKESALERYLKALASHHYE